MLGTNLLFVIRLKNHLADISCLNILNEIRLIQSTEIEIADINKAVSDSLKDIIINEINKIKSTKKDPITKQAFPLLLPFQQQPMNKNLLTVH